MKTKSILRISATFIQQRPTVNFSTKTERTHFRLLAVDCGKVKHLCLSDKICDFVHISKNYGRAL